MAGAAEQRRLFVLLPFSMILGLTVYVLLPAEPSLLHFGVGAALIAATLVLTWKMGSVRGLAFAAQLIAFWIGFCLLPAQAHVFGTAMLKTPAFGEYRVTVDEILSSDAEGARVVVSDIRPLDGARQLPIRRARLLISGQIPAQIGDEIQGKLRLAPVPGPILPGAFDGQFHAYFAGIGAYGNAIGELSIVAEGREGDIARRVQNMRSFIAGRIDAVLEGDTAAIGKAMTMGDQSALSDDTREVMANSGLAHVYSISGLHLSIVAGGVFWLVRLALVLLPFALAWPIKQIAAVAGLSTAFAYMLLAGGLDNVPAFRSTLMLGLIFGAVLAGRRALTMRNVAIAALIIVVIDPASVFRASFQLSFSAVVALIGVYEMPVAKRAGSNSGIERLFRFISATAWTSFVAGAATLLFSAYHFQQTAPLGVLGNVLSLPFVSLIMAFGALAILVMPFGFEAPFLKLMGWNIDRMVDVARMVAGWSEALLGNPILSGWTLLAGLAALAWFAFLENRWRLAGPAFVIPIVLLFGFAPRPDILIADTTQAIAVRDGSGMALVTGKAGSFAVEVWSRYYQTEIAAAHSQARCDALGCILETPKFTLAVVRNAAAFAEDCAGADLIIARISIPASCRSSGQMIGPRDLAQGGVHWLKWDETAGRFDIRPAIETLNRPWRVAPR